MVTLFALMSWVQSEGITFVDLSGNDEPSLSWLILSTFALIGVALLITIGIGAGIGFLRIWVLRRFPRNRLNGPEDEVMTQLHLLDRSGSGAKPDPSTSDSRKVPPPTATTLTAK
jgi:hypothetical protein